MTMPMPGEAWEGATVVASCWISDDPERWVLLGLRQSAPFYVTLEVTVYPTTFATVVLGTDRNIALAAKRYDEATSNGYLDAGPAPIPVPNAWALSGTTKLWMEGVPFGYWMTPGQPYVKQGEPLRPDDHPLYRLPNHPEGT